MSLLKNIQLTFGDNAMSSKVLTSSQIEKIVKTIQRSDITTVYNGYITCDTAISASNAFMLESNGIIYTGSIIPDEYTISASKTTIAEGDEIIFESTGVAVESLSFKVKDITLNSETITKEELLQAISINGNKLKFNSLNKKVDVTGNIIIESNTLYKPYNKKTITLAINSTHITGVTAEYELYEYDKSINLLNFEDTNSKTVTIVPTGIATIGIGSLIASFENSTNNYNITNITNNSVTLNCINFATKEPNKLIIIVKDTLGYTCGTIKIDIDNRIPADININGEESVEAHNGNGSFYYYISYIPNHYNVPIVLKEITSSNNNTSIIINEDNSGFNLEITGISEHTSTIITAKFTVDNIEKVITKNINIIYTKDLTPFIIMNTTGSPQTFGYKMGSETSSFEVAIMQGHVKGVKDYTDIQFSTIDLTTTKVNVTLQDGESFLIQSRTHVPSEYKYLQFVIVSFAPEFDGDVLGTCDCNMVSYACYNMFKNCTGLTNAPVLPATTLAKYCYTAMFDSCTGLINAPVLPATTLEIRCYEYMFSGCTSLTNAPMLPATTLRGGCYSHMFSGCTSLTNAPVLPITTLANSCYEYMFSGCTSLTNAPVLPATTLADNCYVCMFSGCTSLTNAPELPATTATYHCYNSMFYGCKSLTTAPNLPATTLKERCYSRMFKNCTSLVNAPELPATTLVSYCYEYMFEGCTSLTNAPELPATTLGYECYSGMFSGCTGLTTAPNLPATTLTERCYSSMFKNCTGLTTAPELPATSLPNYCYKNMFNGCTSLNYIKAMFLTTPSLSYTENWTNNVSPTGTFVKNASASWDVTGVNGIPENWTVETAIE